MKKAGSTPAVTINKWLDKKIMTQVETFFFRQKARCQLPKVSKEDILSAMGNGLGKQGWMAESHLRKSKR